MRNLYGEASGLVPEEVHSNGEFGLRTIYLPNMALVRNFLNKVGLSYTYYARWEKWGKGGYIMDSVVFAPTLNINIEDGQILTNIVSFLNKNKFKEETYDTYKYTENYNGLYKDYIAHCYDLKISCFNDEETDYIQAYKKRKDAVASGNWGY